MVSAGSVFKMNCESSEPSDGQKIPFDFFTLISMIKF